MVITWPPRISRTARWPVPARRPVSAALTAPVSPLDMGRVTPWIVLVTLTGMVGMAHGRTYPQAGPLREPGTRQPSHLSQRHQPGVDRAAQRSAQCLDRPGRTRRGRLGLGPGGDER